MVGWSHSHPCIHATHSPVGALQQLLPLQPLLLLLPLLPLLSVMAAVGGLAHEANAPRRGGPRRMRRIPDCLKAAAAVPAVRGARQHRAGQDLERWPPLPASPAEEPAVAAAAAAAPAAAARAAARSFLLRRAEPALPQPLSPPLSRPRPEPGQAHARQRNGSSRPVACIGFVTVHGPAPAVAHDDEHAAIHGVHPREGGALRLQCRDDAVRHQQYGAWVWGVLVGPGGGSCVCGVWKVGVGGCVASTWTRVCLALCQPLLTAHIVVPRLLIADGLQHWASNIWGKSEWRSAVTCAAPGVSSDRRQRTCQHSHPPPISARPAKMNTPSVQNTLPAVHCMPVATAAAAAGAAGGDGEGGVVGDSSKLSSSGFGVSRRFMICVLLYRI